MPELCMDYSHQPEWRWPMGGEQEPWVQLNSLGATTFFKK